MFSKLAVAAGLLTSTMAQSVSVVYQDVYTATETVNAACSVCTPGAVSQAYTVVVQNGQTSLVGSGAQPGATAASASSACGFQLAVNGTTILQQISDGQIQASQAPPAVGQISDGQVQSGSGLTASTFTISNGMVYDQAGRICSISGQNQAQFQCNYVPTTGSTTTTFSLSGMNLAFNGNTQFYACLLGAQGQGYNIYQTLTGAQSNCSPVTLTAIGSTNCAPAAPVATAPASAPVASSPAAAAATTPAALPSQASTTGTTVAFRGAASSTSSSISALVLTVALAYFAF